MGKFASLFGDTDTLLKLDCRCLDLENIPFALPSHSFVLLDMLDDSSFALSEKVLMRCRYVVEENTRLLIACNALAHNNVAQFGRLMYLLCVGQMYKYVVSFPELDFLVEQAANFHMVLGSPMMGCGFGVCPILLVSDSATPEFVEKTSVAIEAKFG